MIAKVKAFFARAKAKAGRVVKAVKDYFTNF